MKTWKLQCVQGIDKESIQDFSRGLDRDKTTTLVFTVEDGGLCQSFYMFPSYQNPHTSQWVSLAPTVVVLNLLMLQPLIRFFYVVVTPTTTIKVF